MTSIRGSGALFLPAKPSPSVQLTTQRQLDRTATPWRFHAYQANPQNVGAGLTPIIFDTFQTDPQKLWSPALQGWTCPADGDYLIASSISWDNNTVSGSQAWVSVMVNGVEARRGTQNPLPLTGNLTMVLGTPLVPLHKEDLVQIGVEQTTGFGLHTFASTGYLNWVDIYYLARPV